MIKFKHKETGETINVSQVRTYVNSDGSKRNVDLTSKYDLDEYDEVKEKTDYKSIHCTQAPMPDLQQKDRQKSGKTQ